MSNFIGFLLPAVIDLINRKIADSDARFWLSVSVCVFVGIVISTLNSNGFAGLNPQQIVELIATQSMAIFGMAQLSYKGIWEDSDLRNSLGLNAKTAI